MAESAQAPTELSSQAEVWFLKEITFGEGEERRKFKIITQNFNGPCSFIAVCNVLILRGNIEILPASRDSVSYEFLSQLVGDYLLTTTTDVDISAALSSMPKTQKGMDLNPLFIGPTQFRPGGEGGELQLFKAAGIQLVHGWLVDPNSEAADVLNRAEDYDTAVNMIVDADHASQGRLLVRDEDVALEDQPGPSGSGAAGSSSSNTKHDENAKKVKDAIIIQRFLDDTCTQLTYHGLFQLHLVILPGTLVALFRSSHLSVLYRTPGEDSALYALVTDHVFLHEPTVVWERLEDVDGGSATFVDSDFARSTPVGGDFAGQTEDMLIRMQGSAYVPIDPADEALAHQLQMEEDRRASEAIVHRQQAQDITRRKQQDLSEQRRLNDMRKKADGDRKQKRKKDCLIM